MLRRLFSWWDRRRKRKAALEVFKHWLPEERERRRWQQEEIERRKRNALARDRRDDRWVRVWWSNRRL